MLSFCSVSCRGWFKAAIWSVKQKEDEDDIKVQFINNFIGTPELAVVELQKETAHFGEIVSRMNRYTKELINATEVKTRQKKLKKLTKYERISDEIEIEITEYITKLSDQELTPGTSLIFRSAFKHLQRLRTNWRYLFPNIKSH